MGPLSYIVKGVAYHSLFILTQSQAHQEQTDNSWENGSDSFVVSAILCFISPKTCRIWWMIWKKKERWINKGNNSVAVKSSTIIRFLIRLYTSLVYETRCVCVHEYLWWNIFLICMLSWICVFHCSNNMYDCSVCFIVIVHGRFLC